jgi:uncharacterized membrane protein
MKSILLLILFLVLGIGLTCSGIYYSIKEKNDNESKKVYKICIGIGILFIIISIIKINL